VIERLSLKPPAKMNYLLRLRSWKSKGRMERQYVYISTRSTTCLRSQKYSKITTLGILESIHACTPMVRGFADSCLYGDLVPIRVDSMWLKGFSCRCYICIWSCGTLRVRSGRLEVTSSQGISLMKHLSTHCLDTGYTPVSLRAGGYS
jgi:hypothetical protein